MASLSRPKAQLSCDQCRKKKLKCDRGRPCGRCLKLSPDACSYPQTTSLFSKRPYQSSEIDARIDRLESLVANITLPTYKSLPSTVDEAHYTSVEAEDISESPSQLRVEGDSKRFLKASHWETILDGITGINDALRTGEQSPEGKGPPNSGRPLLLLGMRVDVSVYELICSLPPRQVVEALVDVFINDVGFPSLLTTIHIPSFRSQCDVFWQNPSACSLSWLALLYAILCLALQRAQKLGYGMPAILLPGSASRIYAVKAAQCLIQSDYTKPGPHTIQAMLLYLATEHNENANHTFGARLVFTLIIQQAYRLGFHRDPRHFEEIGFLESEMRRRIWAFIVQMDLLLSEKCGLPRIIDERQTDTQDPMNLLDEDLQANTPLPVSARSNSEPTIVSYMKHKMMALRIHGKITDCIDTPSRLCHEKVLELDQSLSRLAEGRPPWLKPPNNLGNDVSNHPWLLQLIEIDLILNCARLVLHRNYLIPGQSQPRFSYSRSVCLEAARKVLYHQNALCTDKTDAEFGIQVSRFIALMGHRFLLASIIICLDIDQELQARSNSIAATSKESSERAEDVILLHQSQRAWLQCQNQHQEARRGVLIVGAMIERLRRRRSSMDSTAPDASAYGQNPSAFSYSSAATLPSTNGWSADRHGLTDVNAAGVAEIQLNPSIQLQMLGESAIDTDNTELDISIFDTVLNSGQLDIDWMSWDAQYPRSTFNF